MGVQEQPHDRELLEAHVGKLLIRKWIKSVSSSPKLTLKSARHSLLERSDGNQFCDRLLPSGDDDFLAGGSFLQKLREIGLGLMYRVFHS